MKTKRLLVLAALLPLAAATAPMLLNQGWSDDDRAFFYGTTQGTAMYPAAIMQALETADGKPFMARDNLEKYAREKYFMKKENEDVFLIVEAGKENGK